MDPSHRCFVTGASGFIGGHLVRWLKQSGCAVRCQVRSKASAQRVEALGAEPIAADLWNVDELTAAMSGCGRVFHLAALTKTIHASDMRRTNVDGTKAVVEACARLPQPPVLVFISSLAAFGPSKNGQPIDEGSEPHPLSNYGKTKLEAEYTVRQRCHHVPSTIVRPPVVLGEGDLDGLQLFRGIAKTRLHLVPTFRQFRLSLVHVQDLVQAINSVSLRGERLVDQHAATGSYFVACEETPTYADFGRMIAKAIGVSRFVVLPVAKPVVWLVAGTNECLGRLTGSPRLVNWDKSRDALVGPWICSSQKIRSQLNFAEAKSLQDRLDQTAQWYAEQGYFRMRQPVATPLSQAGRD